MTFMSSTLIPSGQIMFATFQDGHVGGGVVSASAICTPFVAVDGERGYAYRPSALCAAVVFVLEEMGMIFGWKTPSWRLKLSPMQEIALVSDWGKDDKRPSYTYSFLTGKLIQ